MKRSIKRSLVVVLSGAALAGCAVPPPAPAYYQTRLQAPVDPYQWHVVSVEPVRRDAQGRIVETPSPIYQSQPVYGAQPVYAPQPVYAYPAPYPAYPRYYNPIPISIGLNFGFIRHSHRHR
jgi:hypothetical protein